MRIDAKMTHKIHLTQIEILKLHSTKQIKVPIFNQRIFSASKPAWRIFDRLWIWLVLHRSSSNQILSWSISQRAVYWQQKVITVHFANMQQVLLFFSQKNKEGLSKISRRRRSKMQRPKTDTVRICTCTAKDYYMPWKPDLYHHC